MTRRRPVAPIRRRSPGRVGEWLELVVAFYRRPVAWVALLVSSLLLTYGGGAVMFWFHAIFRGEQGPAIGDLHHWLLDATLGFVALTPVLGLILPLGVQMFEVAGRAGLRVYVATVAVLFALTTGPGPFLHNLVAGAGTPLARLATDLFGHDASVAARNMHVHDRSPVVEGLFQILVGLPVYLFFTWLALRLVRGVVGRGRRVAVVGGRAAPQLTAAAAAHRGHPAGLRVGADSGAVHEEGGHPV